MSDYDDIPKINTLRAEQQLVQQALANLDAGGTMSAFSIGSLPVAMAPLPAPGGPPPPPMMAVNIMVTEAMPPNVINQVQHWLQDQMKRINDELAALGVTNTPAPPPETKPKGS